MSTKGKYNNGLLEFYESSTHERTLPAGAPVTFEDDFIGKAIDTTNRWTAIDVSAAGLTTPVLTADGLNGVVGLPLDSTSEAQESGLTWGDQRTLGLNQGLVFEARVAFSVLPTTGVAAVWGLAADKNATDDSVTENFWFRAQASGAILAESDDTATDNDDKATGITVVANEYRIYRIDCTVPTDIKFYIDGVRVAASTTFTAAGASATLAVQPYFHIDKASGTGVGTMIVDYVRVWQKRS
jgi:hypothetical protein